jgi:hypothetical protein
MATRFARFASCERDRGPLILRGTRDAAASRSLESVTDGEECETTTEFMNGDLRGVAVN